MWGWAHLEGAQEEVKEELDIAQGALGMLVRDKSEDHLMDAQQRDQRQCGLGQPASSVGGVTGWAHTHPPLPSVCTMGLRGRGCARHPPELVVSVAHLVRAELGDEDLDDADEDEEVDLQWSGVSHEGQGWAGQGQAGQLCPLPRAAPLAPGSGPSQTPSEGLQWAEPQPRTHQDGQEHRKAKDPPEAHVVVGGPAPAEGRDGTAGQPLDWAAAGASCGIGSPS